MWWRRGRAESAMTAVELVMAVSLLGAIVAVFGPVMSSAFNAAEVTQNESRALDEVRNAVSRIDRELRSAKCIDTPVVDTTGTVLTFTTQTFDKTDTTSDYEVTYAVDAQGRLTRTVGLDTTYVGEGIVITSEEFSHSGNPGQRAKVTVKLQVRFDSGNSRNVSTEIAGRNAWAACP